MCVFYTSRVFSFGVEVICPYPCVRASMCACTMRARACICVCSVRTCCARDMGRLGHPPHHGRDSPTLLGSWFTFSGRFPSFAAAHSHPFLHGKYFVAQITQSCFATNFFLVLKVERGDGPGQWPPGPTVLIARHSAQRLRPDRTRTEARTTLASPGGLSVGRQIGRGSPVFSQHRDSALRTDDKQDKPFLFAQNSDTKQHDGRYSTSEICRRSDLRRRPRSFRGQSSTQIGTR